MYYIHPFRRLFAIALVCIMFFGIVGLSAKASGPELPDLSAFLDSPYTQNVRGTYTIYVTCTYPKDEGTAPLDEFLALLQESRYNLEYSGKNQPYKDSYSPATCTDYFFQYTGSASDIDLITTQKGENYHVRVTLYTYSDRDYSAIVLYREPSFKLVDSGVHYGDQPTKTIPGLHDYFNSATRKETADDSTSYFFSFSSLPSSKIRDFSAAMQNLDLEATEQLEMSNGSRLQLFCFDEEIQISVWWHEGDQQVEVTLYDDALKAAGYGQESTNMTSSNRYNNSHFSWDDYDSDIFSDTSSRRSCFSCSGSGRCSTCGGDGRLEHVTSTVVGNYCRTCYGVGSCGYCFGRGYQDW